MKVTVWIVSALLALAFLYYGGTKLLTPAAEMPLLSYGVPPALMRTAGAAEVLGALGLILPAATRIAPILTPLAASGLVAVMLGATITNIAIGTYPALVQTVVLGVLAAFVAWARFTTHAVRPRSATSAGPAARPHPPGAPSA